MHCSAQCVHWTFFFSSRPSAVRHILKSYYRHTIQHIFVPTRSVERNIEKIWFLWASNSKFVIFPQIFPCSNYKICPIIPLLFPGSNGDSPVVTTFPRSNYRGFFTTGKSYCPMYTLFSVLTFARCWPASCCPSPWEQIFLLHGIQGTESSLQPK